MSASRIERIYLIGLRGVGKTSIGRTLAARLGWNAVDTDDHISARAKMPVSDVFRAEGEAAFRKIESGVLREVSAYTRCVISTGGGIVISEENRALIQSDPASLRIWLTADPAVLAERIEADSRTAGLRPRLTSADSWQAELREQLALRAALYREVADLSIDTQHSTIDETTGRIVAALEVSR